MAARPRNALYRDQLRQAIEDLFPPQWFSRFSSHGNDVWTAQKVFWAVTLAAWLAAETLAERFDAVGEVLEEVQPRWKLGASLSGFLDARRRYQDELPKAVVAHLQRRQLDLIEKWRVCGWMLFSVDGSRYETCRTDANERGLGCAGKESTTPQVFQTTLLHVGTDLPWDFRLGPGTDSERRHLDDLLDSLPPKSMLTADAGFISYALCRQLIQSGRRFVLRVGSNMHFLRALGWSVVEKRNTVYLWPEAERRSEPIVLRLIAVKDRRKGQPDRKSKKNRKGKKVGQAQNKSKAEKKRRRRTVYLVTNVLDEKELSDAEAALIYRRRWGQEVHYRSSKQTMGHRKLRSRTPTTSLTEQTWNVLGEWVLQLATAEQLDLYDQPPASWSAAKARDAARLLLRKAPTDKSCPPQEAFAARLSRAVVDDYQRPGPKETRHWPRKKQEKPPGPPNLRSATEKERQKAQRLRNAILTKL